MIDLIRGNWNQRQRVPGEVKMKFTVQRDGLITDVERETTSGYLALDHSAQRALRLTDRLPPLPFGFSDNDLTVHLNFQYQTSGASPGLPGTAPALSTAVGPLARPAQEPVRVGGDVPPPQKVRNVDPVYPEAAKQARVSGVVILEAFIGVDGDVTDVEVLRSVPQLDEAAIAAVRQWEYTPTVVNDLRVPVVMTVTVNFRLATDDDDDDVEKGTADTDPTQDPPAPPSPPPPPPPPTPPPAESPPPPPPPPPSPPPAE